MSLQEAIETIEESLDDWDALNGEERHGALVVVKELLEELDTLPDYVWIGKYYYEGRQRERSVHLTRKGAMHDIAVLSDTRSPAWVDRKDWYDEGVHDDESGYPEEKREKEVENTDSDKSVMVVREQLHTGEPSGVEQS